MMTRRPQWRMKQAYALPGIGAYVATATDQADLGKVLLAVGVMIIMVAGVNVLFLAAADRVGRAVPGRGVRGRRRSP